MFIYIYIYLYIYIFIYLYIYFSRSLKLIIAYGFRSSNAQVAAFSVPVTAGQRPAVNVTLVKSFTLSGVVMQTSGCIDILDRRNSVCKPR